MPRSKGTGGRGWSGPLLGRIQKVLDSLTGGPPVPFQEGFAWDSEGGKESSVNHRAMAWTCEAARSAANGEKEALDRAADVLLQVYFPREFGALWAGETMAPDNHSHQHLAATGMARIAAVLSGRKDLLEASGELLRRTTAALLSVATPEQLFICSAGVRAKGKPSWWAGTAWLRQVKKFPGPMPEFERNPENWKSGQGACVRAIRYLWENQGDDLGGAAKVEADGCLVKHPFTVYRKEGDRHLVVMHKTVDSPGREVCDWVEVPHRRFADYASFMASVRFGMNWEKPAPTPPSGSGMFTFPSAGAKEPPAPVKPPAPPEENLARKVEELAADKLRLLAQVELLKLQVSQGVSREHGYLLEILDKQERIEELGETAEIVGVRDRQHLERIEQLEAELAAYRHELEMAGFNPRPDRIRFMHEEDKALRQDNLRLVNSLEREGHNLEEFARKVEELELERKFLLSELDRLEAEVAKLKQEPEEEPFFPFAATEYIRALQEREAQREREEKDQLRRDAMDAMVAAQLPGPLACDRGSEEGYLSGELSPNEQLMPAPGLAQEDIVPVVQIERREEPRHFLIIGKFTGGPIGCMNNPDEEAFRHAELEDPGVTFQPVDPAECPVCDYFGGEESREEE